jgi:periplasmic protein CpxP/Spy
MFKKIIIIFAAVIAAGGVLFATGCGRRYSCSTPEQKAQWMVDILKNKLDLSKEQVKVVNSIKDEILAKQDDFRDLRKGFYETILNEVRSDKFDANKVNQLFTANEAKFRELRSFMISELAKFHAVLTPEQREQIAKKMEERRMECNNK